jgi:hypothetical protein
VSEEAEAPKLWIKYSTAASQPRAFTRKERLSPCVDVNM